MSHYVDGVAIQGVVHDSLDISAFVQTFVLEFSLGNDTWITYTGNRNDTKVIYLLLNDTLPFTK